MPIFLDLQRSGLSLRRIAATLNEHGVKSARGGKWQAATVRNSSAS
ncbi:MAG: recombinase family protein [Rhodobacter sp.]|nr:recombinase family protein [Rhodobacter sp.]